MARPLAVIGITYFLALLTANLVGNPVSALLSALLFLFFLLALFFRSLRARAGLMAALLAAGAAFCVYACYDAAVVRPLTALDGGRVTVTGLVTAEPAMSSSGTRRITLKTVGAPLPEGTKLTVWITDLECTPELGDTFTAPVRLSRTEPYGGILPAHLSKGSYLQAFVTDYAAAIVQPAEKTPLFARLHGGALERLYAAYGGDAAGLTAGICFGDTALLSDNASDSLAGAGLSHLTAVSGLHMTIIAGAVYGLLRLLRVPKRAAAGINILAMLFFMGVTLFPVSAVRAGMMQIVMMLGYVLSRKADGLNSLGLALLLLVLFQPYAACDPGLLLSFAATLGLLTVLPWLRRSPWLRRMERRRILGKAAASLAVSFAALAFTMPIIGLCFGEVSLMSPLSNLLAIPAAAALMQTGCLAVLVSFVPFLDFAAKGLFFLSDCLARYLLAIAEGLGQTPLSAVSVRQGFVLLWLLILPPVLFLGWRLLRWKGVRMASAFAAIILFCGMFTHLFFMRGVTTVTVLETGDSTALLLERDGHSGLLITGDEKRTMRSVGYSLRERGIRKLDFILLPSSDDGCVWGMGQLGDSGMKQVAAPSEGKYAYQLDAFVPADKRLDWPVTGDLTFWNDCRLERGTAGWLRLLIGETRLLLCPSGGDAGSLPASWKQTHAVLYSHKPPQNADGIQAGSGVWSCEIKTLEKEENRLPWRRYPIQTTAEAGDIVLMTRGAGDITVPGAG